jgi:hypothetical protein
MTNHSNACNGGDHCGYCYTGQWTSEAGRLPGDLTDTPHRQRSREGSRSSEQPCRSGHVSVRYLLRHRQVHSDPDSRSEICGDQQRYDEVQVPSVQDQRRSAEEHRGEEEHCLPRSRQAPPEPR